MSLIVPDFKFGSSCKFIFFGLILSSFLYIFPGLPICLGNANKQKEKAKEREVLVGRKKSHEMLYTEMSKSGTIRLASG